jgi:hypothetical protein
VTARDPSPPTSQFRTVPDVTIPRAGDFAVVQTGTSVTSIISLMERLDDFVTRSPQGGWEKWDHAVMCVGWTVGKGSTPGVPLIVEAEPGGAVLRPWHYQDRLFQWSTGLVPVTDAQRESAAMMAGRLADAHVGYGWMDYEALVAHALHIPVPGLQAFIGDSRRLICSQLVDFCYASAGAHLFKDGRWPGYVKPSDLGYLLASG